MMMFIINIITLARIIFAMVIFVLLTINNNYVAAIMLFFLAGLSDYFDGFLARKYELTSVLGEILDPIADKILIIFLFFGLALNLSSLLIGFAGSLIIAREIWVSALRDINSRFDNTDATKVTFLAKTKTSLQLFTIFVYLFALATNTMLLLIIGDIFMIISVLVTMYTGYIYTVNTFQKLK
jgi:CDP-diacylglycerol--glycerol-3-phosphate 3-phosphatidyltransferase